MGPYAGADYNLTLCPLQNRLSWGLWILPLVYIVHTREEVVHTVEG